MKKILMAFLILLSLFLIGCSCQTPEKISPAENLAEENIDANPPSETESPNPDIPETAPKPKIQCTHNANCSVGEYCLNGNCGKLAEVYQAKLETCNKKCKINSLSIYTSDGESYDLSLGQGSYTAASALEWKTMTTPEFCAEDEVIVFIKILKRNYGNILGDEVITLKEGETSKIITHPLMPEVKFTLMVKNLDKVCS